MRILILLFFTFVTSNYVYSEWTVLSPGLEYGVFKASTKSEIGNSEIAIVRIDPKLWELDLFAKSESEGAKNQTAKQWSKSHDLVAVINAGMFGADYSTHIGYMGTARHVNNKRISKYQSVAAFAAKEGKKVPSFKMFDLDKPDITMQKILTDYDSVIQNLRLIKKPGENRWSQQDRLWSEAALGEDKSGNALFIFSRSPYTMHDLNHELLNLGIGLVAAQHLEGGPEAQLYINIADVEYEMFGSFETSFVENDGNQISWPVPNVIGVRAKKETH